MRRPYDETDAADEEDDAGAGRRRLLFAREYRRWRQKPRRRGTRRRAF